MVRGLASLALVLILAQIAAAFVLNDTLLEDIDNTLKDIKTRRKDHSTSSDSSSGGDAKDGHDSESLNVKRSESETSSESESQHKKKKKKKKKRKDDEPVSTVERKGWRKWHRKCTKCPGDMHKKWRDPSIKWICGAYQRARRTFKSLCMMHYRNCQDGTMFTKISDHRCANSTGTGIYPYRQHFFYDYSVALTDDDTETQSHTFSASDSESSDISDSELEKNMPPFDWRGP